MLAPRWDYTAKHAGPKPGFDYGPEGYQEGRSNVGVEESTGRVHVEIHGLKEPMSPEAARICREDLNEVVAAFAQNKEALSRGLFDAENTIPQETTQIVVGKIVRDRYPELSEDDVEAVRQREVAALNLVQQGRKQNDAVQANLGLIEGVRKFVLSVRDLSVDLIDAINPFGEAYSVLARSMNAETLRQMQEKIAARKVKMPFDEAHAFAKRAVAFKRERGRAPSITAGDPWEKKMAEGVAAYERHLQEQLSAATEQRA